MAGALQGRKLRIGGPCMAINCEYGPCRAGGTTALRRARTLGVRVTGSRRTHSSQNTEGEGKISANIICYYPFEERKRGGARWQEKRVFLTKYQFFHAQVVTNGLFG